MKDFGNIIEVNNPDQSVPTIKGSNSDFYLKAVTESFSRTKVETNFDFINKVLTTINVELGEFFLPPVYESWEESFAELSNNLNSKDVNSISTLHRRVCILGKAIIMNNCNITPEKIMEIEGYLMNILNYPVIFKTRRLLIEIFSIATSYRGIFNQYKIRNSQLMRIFQYNVLLPNFRKTNLLNDKDLKFLNNQKISTQDEFEYRLMVSKILEYFAVEFDFKKLPIDENIIGDFMTSMVQVVKSFIKLTKESLIKVQSCNKDYKEKFFFTSSFFDICYDTVLNLVNCKISKEYIILKFRGICDGLDVISKDLFELFSVNPYKSLIINNGLNDDIMNIIDKIIKLEIKVCNISKTADHRAMFKKQIYHWRKVFKFMKEIENTSHYNSNNVSKTFVGLLEEYYEEFIEISKCY